VASRAPISLPLCDGFRIAPPLVRGASAASIVVTLLTVRCSYGVCLVAKTVKPLVALVCTGGKPGSWRLRGEQALRKASQCTGVTLLYHCPAMTTQRTAIVLGGSGSVGVALLHELFLDDGFDAVITLSRRSLPEAVAMARTSGRRLVEKLVADMKPVSLAAATLEAARETDGELEGFSVLGVGANTARLTLDEHRAVDVQLNEAFARGLRDSGKVRHLAFMSAVGANPAAKASGNGAAGMARYSRVKGESEEAVRASGPAVVSVFRPAMIIGSQHTPWLLEKALPLLSFATPGNYKSIRVDQIAKAMIATAKRHPSASKTYHYPEMVALIAGG
jgi:hypothetical protein